MCFIISFWMSQYKLCISLLASKHTKDIPKTLEYTHANTLRLHRRILGLVTHRIQQSLKKRGTTYTETRPYFYSKMCTKRAAGKGHRTPLWSWVRYVTAVTSCAYDRVAKAKSAKFTSIQPIHACLNANFFICLIRPLLTLESKK